MIYLAYTHPGDEHHAYSVTLPDFKGCFSAADKYEDIPAKVQEAIELYFEDEDFALPAPSDINVLEASGNYSGSIWMLINC